MKLQRRPIGHIALTSNAGLFLHLVYNQLVKGEDPVRNPDPICSTALVGELANKCLCNRTKGRILCMYSESLSPKAVFYIQKDKVFGIGLEVFEE
jgi:hypothetical protein